VYLDAVHYFMPGRSGLNAAIEYAYNLGQKAIYDFEQRRSIRVTESEYQRAYAEARGLEDRRPGQSYDS
jgi:hypothetical protein